MYEGLLGGLVRRYGWQKFQTAAWFIALAGILACVLPFALEGAPFSGFTKTFWGQIMISSGLLLFAFGLAGIIMTPPLRRRYAIFDAALAHNLERAPLVADQPIPDIEALELPARIDLKPRASRTVIVAIMLWIFLIAVFLITRYLVLLLIMAPFAISSIAAAIQGRGVAIDANDQQISIDQDVIAVSPNSTRRGAIAWDEVRVFALVYGGRGPRATKCYMLSSGDTEVRWMHRPRTRWYSLAAPATSDEVYDQQMRALLSYAVARTGLSLVDMR